MLFHHDGRGYDEAAKAAADHARAKMTRIIEDGRGSASAVIQRVMTEVPEDLLAAGRAIRFRSVVDANDEGARRAALDGTDTAGLPAAVADVLVEHEQRGRDDDDDDRPRSLVLDVADKTYRVHKHALGQLCGKAGIPLQYLASLVTSPNPSLRGAGLQLLDAHYHDTDLAGQRNLLRSVGGELRGFLSDRFRRLDCRRLVDAFASACHVIGAVPVHGVASDVRVQLKAILPTIFEPIENEPTVYGLAWGNSDYGGGANVLSVVILRLWCTNYATTETAIRQVHLGRVLSDDVAWSQKTINLDTEASESALSDAVRGLLGEERIEQINAAIRAANDKSISWDAVKRHLSTGLLGKAEATETKRLFEEEQDVEILQIGRAHV